jgi:mycothiol synthase
MSMVNLPEGYQMRPARMDDLEAMIDMLNAGSRQLFGLEHFNAGDVKSDWSTPNFDLEGDARVVVAPDGKIVGYEDVFYLNEPFVNAHCWGRVHPEHAGKGIGWALLGWANERACQTVARAPSGARVVMVTSAPTIDLTAQPLFLEAGYGLVRYFLRMVIELDGLPPEPEWPEGITLKGFILGEDDNRVVQALRDSFSDHWGTVEKPFEDELAEFRNMWRTNVKLDPTLCFQAMAGDEVAGISLCEPVADDDPEMGWVRSLGVRRPWRRQGLGLALLQHSFRVFQQRGSCRVGLGVDAESLTGATRLYTKAGMHPDPRWQLSVFEKELRPGKELRKVSAG